MAEAAVGFLLDNLTQLLRYNAELIGDAREEVERLLEDLKVFKGVIHDFTEQPGKTHTMQELVNSIRSVVDEAEDAIDKFLVEQAMYKNKTVLGKATNLISHFNTVKKVALKIQSLRKRVSEIYTEKQFAFKTETPESSRSKPEKKPPSVEQDDVVGFDGEAKTVIERLIKGDQDLDIITIVGMAGLGKTTLARKIYDDKAIEYEFFTRAWVFVSQNYSKREVFLSILGQTTTTNYSDKSDDFIAAELRRNLDGGKYLVVMDDVWTNDAWNDLKNVFPHHEKGSRILITSRHAHVAKCANPGKEPHNLKFLEPHESWELLEKRVFGKEKCPPSELDLGKLIATRCKGLPLALVVIAGVILNNAQSNEWWKQVAENVKSFIVEKQEPLLALSYNHLPYHLKSCFLYLGVFPEDYEIHVWRLILLWVAEGFIELKAVGRSLEDIAEAYVEDLANRSLVMVAQRKPNGQIKTCRVHDIMHKFCKEESHKQMLYQVVENTNNHPTLESYRRVCIHSRVKKYVSSKPSGEHVRSFLCFAPGETVLERAHMSAIPKAFGLLRVLEIRSITFEIFPKDLLLLALLRYIAVTCNIKALPSSISRLWNMQTMVFMTNSRTLELKEDVWKMYQLRHLVTNASALLPPPPSKTPSNRESVQSLSRISPQCCTEQLFARTPNIKKLGIRGEMEVLFSKLFANIGKLEHLTNLKLFNDIAPASSSDEVRTLRLPPAHEFPLKLQKLTLSDTSLPWEQMPTLEKLEKLEELKLKENAFKGASWKSGEGGFPSLKLLHIGRTDLETWSASKLSFPSLTHLVIQHCEKLQGVPSGLADVKSLKLLKLHRTSKAAVVSARNLKGSFKLDIYPPDQ